MKSRYYKLLLLILSINIVFPSILHAQLLDSLKENTVNEDTTIRNIITARADKIREELQKSREETKQALEAYRNATQESRFDALNNYGQKLIKNRLKHLEQTRTRIQNTENISKEDKESVIAYLDASYNGLSGLQDDLESSPDIESMKSVIENIFYDYRVYLVELPRDVGLASVYSTEYIIENDISDVLDKVNLYIKALSIKGEDVTQLELLILELEENLTEITELLNKAETSFKAMNPDKDVTPSQDHLEVAKKNLIEAKNLVIETYTIIEEIIIELEKLSE